MKKTLDHIKRLIHDATGSPTLETALLLPIVIIALLGSVDVFRMMWTKNAVDYVAAEGAHLAKMHAPTNAEITGFITSKMAERGVSQAPAVTISARQPGQPVTVTVSVPADYIFLPTWMGRAMDVGTITSSSVMDHEP